MSSYSEYLISPEWLEKRRRFIERTDKRCYCCGGADTLEVHHVTYERLGRERDSDLRLVCTACHARIHQLAEATGASIELTTEVLTIDWRSVAKPADEKDFIEPALAEDPPLPWWHL